MTLKELLIQELDNVSDPLIVEVAKLVEYDRLILPCSLEEWFATALAYPGIQLLDLTLPIIVESARLTGFHKDPADRLIVATA